MKGIPVVFDDFANGEASRYIVPTFISDLLVANPNKFGYFVQFSGPFKSFLLFVIALLFFNWYFYRSYRSFWHVRKRKPWDGDQEGEKGKHTEKHKKGEKGK